MRVLHPSDPNFVSTFVKYANEHDSCLEEKDYSKRYRLNKTLLAMLMELKQYENSEDVVEQILEARSDCATLWISNFARTNHIYKEFVEAKLREIASEKCGANNLMAWTLLNAKQKEGDK